MDYSDDEEDDDKEEDESKLTAKFTGEGLVYVNKKGEVVKRAGESNDDEGTADGGEDDGSDSDDEHAGGAVLKVGMRVKANYRAHEQFQERDHWYAGVISKVNEDSHGNVTYNVDYEDGDFEEEIGPENVRAVGKTDEEKANGGRQTR